MVSIFACTRPVVFTSSFCSFKWGIPKTMGTFFRVSRVKILLVYLGQYRGPPHFGKHPNRFWWKDIKGNLKGTPWKGGALGRLREV